MDIKKLYELVENVETSVLNHQDSRKDEDNLINFLLKNNNMKDPQTTLLLSQVTDLIGNINMEYYDEVPESLRKLLKTLKLLGVSKESDYDILKHNNMKTGNDIDDYIELEKIII